MMVLPDLERPGTTAKPWINPMFKAFNAVMLSMSRLDRDFFINIIKVQMLLISIPQNL